MRAPDLAKNLARTTKAAKSKEREAEEEIASATHRSTTYTELWDADAYATLQMLYVQECCFSNISVPKHIDA